MKVLGHNPGGLWGVVLHLKDISLMEDLKHTLRAGYYHGTNNSAMPKAANMASYPSRIDGPFAYLTTSDDAWELNADTRYKIYENLELAVEAAYVRLNLDEGTWGKKIVNEVDKDSYRVSIWAEVFVLVCPVYGEKAGGGLPAFFVGASDSNKGQCAKGWLPRHSEQKACPCDTAMRLTNSSASICDGNRLSASSSALRVVTSTSVS